MKYFRAYPWGMQLLLLVLMSFTLLSAAQVVIGSLMFKVTGVSPTQISGIGPGTSQTIINAALWVQGVGNFIIYFLTAFVFAYLAHPNPTGYVGMRRPVRIFHFPLVVAMMLGAMPVLAAAEGWVAMIDLGPTVKAEQLANDQVFRAFLDIHDPITLVRTLIILAIIPAMGEELFFRGVLMRLVKKRTSTMTVPILFTAAVFAYSHSTVYGLPSVFAAGILLALVYYWTGSLWCGIVAHMFFNGSQILLSYLGNDNYAVKSLMESASVPNSLVAAGAVVFGLSFYMLYKTRSPLPPNWDDDFQGEQPINIGNTIEE